MYGYRSFEQAETNGKFWIFQDSFDAYHLITSFSEYLIDDEYFYSILVSNNLTKLIEEIEFTPENYNTRLHQCDCIYKNEFSSQNRSKRGYDDNDDDNDDDDDDLNNLNQNLSNKSRRIE
jgi:hypothetical protein